jgi:hypothetical protein
MQIVPITTQVNGTVTVKFMVNFVGDATDATDRANILAFGDPQINLGGARQDPNDQTFHYNFPTNQNFVGITTQLPSIPIQFMTALPTTFTPGCPPQQAGPTTCLTPSPSRAALLFITAIETEIEAAMTALRALTPIVNPGNTTV